MQITCNTSGTHHVQHVVYHGVQRDTRDALRDNSRPTRCVARDLYTIARWLLECMCKRKLAEESVKNSRTVAFIVSIILIINL